MLLTRSPLNLDRSPSRVRLACVRHAASVDSEPGSNSHVKSAVTPSTRPLPRARSGLATFNASVDDLALLALLFGLVSTSTSALRPSSMPESESCRTRLTLDGSIKYLHALSSFQRTGLAPNRSRPFEALALSRRTFRPVSGEPSKVTSHCLCCQAHGLGETRGGSSGREVRR